MSNSVDLVQLFSSVSSTLMENQSALNSADTRNGDHGDNMVQIFDLISSAMGEKESGDHAAQLAHAGQMLAKQDSGSAQLYAKGFEQAAAQFQGKDVDPGAALMLIQTLMGAGQEAHAPEANPLGALLGGLMGGGSDSAADDGEEKLFDMDDLIRGGMSFFSARQSGATNKEAMIQALLAASPFGETPHRAQSSELVAQTLLQTLGNMAGQ